MDRRLYKKYRRLIDLGKEIDFRDGMILECFENIIRDIKILDILKENATLYVNDINKEVKSIQISITTCDDRFEKVEEWLNNE